jgi:hypothetical protein
MVRPEGGAMGLLSTSRTVYAGPNESLNLKLIKYLMARDENGVPLSLGEAHRLAKNELAGDANRLSFIFLGDPSVRLMVPVSHKVMIDSINGVYVTEDNADTLKALQVVTLSGSVADIDGNFDASFNGYVHVSVFDKEENVTTLANDAGSRPYVFRYRANAIFAGTAEVRDGIFSIQFQMPKDIKYRYGGGRIVMYAVDEENNYEANGSYDKCFVGGEYTNAPFENNGPQLDIYLNTPNFIDGGKVNDSPLFVANIKDESGINTIGSGIGHDIVMILDNDPKQEYRLNNYYQSVMGSYKEGSVYYQLSGLAEGKHTLFFRVWDVQNNSSSAELQFEVVKDLPTELFEVYAYPNPTSGPVNFVCVHDRPGLPMSISLIVYDLAGRMIWRSEKTAVTDNTSQTILDWDLRSASGNGTGDGLYLARLIFEDKNGIKSVKTVKIIVRTQ